MKMDGQLALKWCELFMEYDGVSVHEVLKEKCCGKSGDGGSSGAWPKNGTVSAGNENLRELFRTMNNSNNIMQKENRRERAARYKGGKPRRNHV